MTPASSTSEVLQKISAEIGNVRERDLLQLGNLIEIIDYAPGAANSPEIQNIRNKTGGVIAGSPVLFETTRE